MAEKKVKISLIFEIKQLDREQNCWCNCAQCGKSNLKKAIVINDGKVDYKGGWPNLDHDEYWLSLKIFNNLYKRDPNNLHKLKYFCSKGCAKLYFEIKSKNPVDKWIKW